MKRALGNYNPDFSIIGPTKTSQVILLESVRVLTRKTFKRGICKQRWRVCDINLQVINQHALQKIKHVRGNQMPFMIKTTF